MNISEQDWTPSLVMWLCVSCCVWQRRRVWWWFWDQA